jgi:hypothetical protein
VSKLQLPTSTIQFLWWGLPIQAFLGPGWGEVLILLEFVWKYPNVHLQKKHTSELKSSKIFKNIFLLVESIKARVQI